MVTTGKNLELQIIYEAYRKLKNYFYYDNTSLFIRKRIVEFEECFYNTSTEAGFKKAFQESMVPLLAILNQEDGWKVRWNELLGQIDCNLLPKTVQEENKSNDSEISVITNRNDDSNMRITKVNALIDAPVEIHILSVLWIMYVGLKMSSMIQQNNYAYLLATHGGDESESLDGGLSSFQPYFLGYQNWRDKALEKAKRPQLFVETSV